MADNVFQPVADKMATIQPLADNVSQPVADNMAEKCIAAATAQVLDEGDEPPLKKQRISADAEKVAEETPAAGGTATPDSSDSSVGADKDLKKVLKYLSRALEKVQHLLPKDKSAIGDAFSRSVGISEESSV